MSTSRWTKEQLKLAFYLYCQLAFGRLHSRNPEIIQLAKLIGRTPGTVAMKLVNFASLDPAITMLDGEQVFVNSCAECNREVLVVEN